MIFVRNRSNMSCIVPDPCPCQVGFNLLMRKPNLAGSRRAVSTAEVFTAEPWIKNLHFCTIQAEAEWQCVTVTLCPVGIIPNWTEGDTEGDKISAVDCGGDLQSIARNC